MFLSFWSILLGAGGLAAFVTCPVDVIKTLRQKHQTEGISSYLWWHREAMFVTRGSWEMSAWKSKQSLVAHCLLPPLCSKVGFVLKESSYSWIVALQVLSHAVPKDGPQNQGLDQSQDHIEWETQFLGFCFSRFRKYWDSFCNLKFWDATEWVPTSNKRTYNPYKWPYEWLSGVITLLIGVVTYNPIYNC